MNSLNCTGRFFFSKLETGSFQRMIFAQENSEFMKFSDYSVENIRRCTTEVFFPLNRIKSLKIKMVKVMRINKFLFAFDLESGGKVFYKFSYSNWYESLAGLFIAWLHLVLVGVLYLGLFKFFIDVWSIECNDEMKFAVSFASIIRKLLPTGQPKTEEEIEFEAKFEEIFLVCKYGKTREWNFDENVTRINGNFLLQRLLSEFWSLQLCWEFLDSSLIDVFKELNQWGSVKVNDFL